MACPVPWRAAGTDTGDKRYLELDDCPRFSVRGFPHGKGRTRRLQRWMIEAIRSAFGYHASMKCPYCEGPTRLRWTLGNLARVVSIIALVVASLGIGLLGGPGEATADATKSVHFKRRCRQCGAIFSATKPLPDGAVCGQCGYNLTGNTSGTCPECSWVIKSPALCSTVKNATHLRLRVPEILTSLFRRF